MKLSAAILILFAAAPSYASDWAPAMDAAAIAAAEVPAPGTPRAALPRDGENYSAAEEMLIKEFGVTGISMDVPEAEVIRQYADYAGGRSFEPAFRDALESFLGDHSAGTVLGDVLKELGVTGAPGKSQQKKARAELLARLNGGSAKIALVQPYRHYQPANGEKVEENWVFYLNVAGRVYWAVSPRSGGETYNYGAN